MPETAALSSRPINILLVDDHPVVLDGLHALISQHSAMQVVGSVASGTQALDAYNVLRPDVLVTDMSLPDMDGATLIARVRVHYPDAVALILSVHGSAADVQKAVSSGCRGYLLKTAGRQEIHRAIETVHSGGVYFPPNVVLQMIQPRRDEILTARETDVLRLLAIGKRNKQIALSLCMSESTVRTHVAHILAKLELDSRTEAAVHSLTRELIGRP